MANKPQLGLQDLYPYLSNQTGFNGQAPSPIESLLASFGGPSATSNIKAFSNPSAIGADNNTLATQAMNSTSNIFNLIQEHMQSATARAIETAQRTAQAEAEKKAAALQAKLLKAQKDAALNALKSLPKSSGNSSGPISNYSLTPMPNLNGSSGVKAPKIPKVVEQEPVIKLPLAPGFKPDKPKPRKVVKRDPRKPGIQN